MGLLITPYLWIKGKLYHKGDPMDRPFGGKNLKYLIILFSLLICVLNTDATAVTFESLYKASGNITSIGKGYFQISEITDFVQESNTFYILDNFKKAIFFYNKKKSRIYFEKKLIHDEYINLFKYPFDVKHVLIFSKGRSFID